jgi:hypothetical protein
VFRPQPCAVIESDETRLPRSRSTLRSVHPRHEIKLELDIVPIQNTATDRTGVQRAVVRLGGILNYEDVVRTSKGLNTNESLYHFKDAPGPKATKRLIDIEFDRTDQRLQILTRHVQEQAPRPMPEPREPTG